MLMLSPITEKFPSFSFIRYATNRYTVRETMIHSPLELEQQHTGHVSCTGAVN